ncbi:MAG: V-type ATP synthase subunit E [Acidimicrobiales bacterium]
MTVALPSPRNTEADTLGHALEPVRQALLADAKAEADRIVSAAVDAAAELIAQAQAGADEAVDQARHRAELAAQVYAEQRLAQIRSDSHRAVLDTQAQLGQRLLDEVHTAARALRGDPRYPALLDHLESLARSQLGDGAVVDRDPEPGGGIVARAGARRVDYRLVALADRAIDTLADEVAELWA